MPRTIARSQKLILEAIAKNTDGMTSSVARSLGISRSTFYNYLGRFPKVAEAWDDTRGAATETLESVAFRLAKEGNVPLLMFLLRTINKDRGYGSNALDNHSVYLPITLSVMNEKELNEE